MPTFIDRHALVAVPSALRSRMYVEANQEIMDSHGVRTVGHWVDRGLMYCILEAPDVDAVGQYHTDRGLPCDDVQALDDLDRRAPTSDNNEARLRAAITRLCHSLARKHLDELGRHRVRG